MNLKEEEPEDSSTIPYSRSPAPKSVKKKKSITRLFSTSSKKSSKSGSSSKEDLNDPSTQPLHVQVWPLPSASSPRIPSMRFDSFANQIIDQKQKGKESSGEQQSQSMAATKASGEADPTTRIRPAQRNFSVPARCSSYGSGGGEEEPLHTTNAVQVLQAEKPTMQHAPTFPGSPKPIKTGLRMPLAFSSLPRGRGASVTTPETNPKSFVAQPQLSRPSTAGGETYSKPTGKRRPGGNIAGLDGAFPFTTFEELPHTPKRPWQTTYSHAEVRSSFRSALTSSSSLVDTTSTERSSVATEGTSMTESTVDVHYRPTSKPDGMTVDDAIDLYAAGFVDDEEPDTGDSRNTSISEEERRRSLRIAEAINDSIGAGVSPARPTVGVPPKSPAVEPDDSYKPVPVLPAISAPTPLRDQYGFLKANHHITIQQHDGWSTTYNPDQQRRTTKWNTYMQEQGLATSSPSQFPRRSTKAERFIRKGIPPAWRGPAWFFYAGGNAYLERHAGLYTYLVDRSEAKLSEHDKEAIERDLHRTFPDNVHFKPDAPASPGAIVEPPMLTSLRRVLRAFAFHSPRIGYCQSLNFLTGLLLLFLPEEKSFWMLHIITAVYLPGTHEISLEGANVDLWVLMVALKSTMPNIWTKVGAAGTPADGLDSSARLPPISLCTTSWFMSLFIGTLPIESVLRVWDVLFYEGSRTIFRVALTIFKLGEQRIKSVGDSMELFQVVQGLPRGMLDAGALMTAVCRRGGVGAEWIEARRWERREWYSKERARSLVPMDEGGRNEYFAQKGDTVQKSDSEGLKRKESRWRKKRKASAPQQGGSPRLHPNEDSPIPSPSPSGIMSGAARELLSA